MKNSKLINRTVYAALALLSLTGIFIVIRRTILVVPVLINGYQPPAVTSMFTQMDEIFAHHPVLTLIHIIPGLFFVVSGPFQFMQRISIRYPRLQRLGGRVFLASGMIIGITALVMSFAMPAIGGINQAAATTMFSLVFLYYLLKAFQQLRQGKTAAHREWVIRAYAIGLAVASIRIINGIFFATSRITHLSPHEFFGIGFWIGFVIHLLLAEFWISRTRLLKTAVSINDLTKDSFTSFERLNN